MTCQEMILMIQTTVTLVLGGIFEEEAMRRPWGEFGGSERCLPRKTRATKYFLVFVCGNCIV